MTSRASPTARWPGPTTRTTRRAVSRPNRPCPSPSAGASHAHKRIARSSRQSPPVRTQPPPRGLIVRVRLAHEFPVFRRVVEPAKVHQLVDEHIVPYPRRHLDESPVQTDVA